MSYCMLMTTFASEEAAIKMGGILVETKLAACCQVIPGISSIYMWKGKLERAKEFLLLVKTREYLAENVEKSILEKHSYDKPEIIQINIDDGNSDYLNWIDCSTSKNKKIC